VIRSWHGYLSGPCGSAYATAAPSSLASFKIEIGSTFLVLACPGCPGKETVKWVSVEVVCNRSFRHIVLNPYFFAADAEFSRGQKTHWKELLTSSWKM